MLINAHSLITAVKALVNISAVNDDREFLNGLHFFDRNGKLTIEASNGRVVGRVALDLNGDGIDGIVPIELCKQLAKFKVLKKARDSMHVDVSFDLKALKVSFKMEGQSLGGELIDRRYPYVDNILRVPSSKQSDVKRGVRLSHLALIAKSAGILAHPRHDQAALLGTASAYDSFYFEVPTNHKLFSQISEPAVFMAQASRI